MLMQQQQQTVPTHRQGHRFRAASQRADGPSLLGYEIGPKSRAGRLRYYERSTQLTKKEGLYSLRNTRPSIIYLSKHKYSFALQEHHVKPSWKTRVPPALSWNNSSRDRNHNRACAGGLCTQGGSCRHEHIQVL